MTLGVTLSRCVCVRRISLGGEGNALYPVLSSSVGFAALTHCTVKPASSGAVRLRQLNTLGHTSRMPPSADSRVYAEKKDHPIDFVG